MLGDTKPAPPPSGHITVTGSVSSPARGCLHTPPPPPLQLPWVQLHPLSPRRSRRDPALPSWGRCRAPVPWGQGQMCRGGQGRKQIWGENTPKETWLCSSFPSQPWSRPLRAAQLAPAPRQSRPAPAQPGSILHPSRGAGAGWGMFLAGGERAPRAGFWGNIPSLCRLPAGRVMWIEKDQEEGTGKHLAAVVCAVCSTGTSVSPAWERERCRGGSPPQRATKGCHRVG